MGLSQTPAFRVAVQAMLTFIAALAAYWFSTKGPTFQEGRGAEVGAYLVNFVLTLLIGAYIGTYYRVAAPFQGEMRATYWGLTLATTKKATTGTGSFFNPFTMNPPPVPRK